MYTTSVICIVLFAFSQVHSFYLVNSENGEVYYLARRSKRDTTFDVSGQGTKANRVTVGQNTDILKLGGGDHVLNAGGLVSKPFGNNLPTSVGGTLGYNHAQSGTSVNANVIQTPKFGTDVGLQASKVLWANGGSRLEANAGVQKHLGGVFGDQRAQGNVGLHFIHMFNDRGWRCQMLRTGC